MVSHSVCITKCWEQTTAFCNWIPHKWSEFWNGCASLLFNASSGQGKWYLIKLNLIIINYLTEVGGGKIATIVSFGAFNATSSLKFGAPSNGEISSVNNNTPSVT